MGVGVIAGVSFCGLYALEVRLCRVIGFLSEKRTVGGWVSGDACGGDAGRLVLLFFAPYCGIGNGEDAAFAAACCVLDADAVVLACCRSGGLVRVSSSCSGSESDSVESLTLAWYDLVSFLGGICSRPVSYSVSADHSRDMRGAAGAFFIK